MNSWNFVQDDFGAAIHLRAEDRKITKPIIMWYWFETEEFYMRSHRGDATFLPKNWILA